MLGDIAFIDRGPRIEIQDWRNRESVLAALHLSHEKWEVPGNEQYKTICAELARSHGFKIINPELRPPSEPCNSWSGLIPKPHTPGDNPETSKGNELLRKAP